MSATAHLANSNSVPIGSSRVSNLKQQQQEAQTALVVVARQNQRLAHLLQDLLLLSRMDRQALAEKYRPCCLNDLLSDLVESLSILEIATPLKLTNDFKVQAPLVVMGDEDQLCRLFTNLITNARHYTPAGGKVAVLLERDDHSALVHMQDTGIGIAPTEQARIFDRFYRVNSDRSRYTGGAGLGLAIDKAIAQSHQGDIKVQSELGQGSTLTARLPLGMPSRRVAIGTNFVLIHLSAQSFDVGRKHYAFTNRAVFIAQPQLLPEVVVQEKS